MVYKIKFIKVIGISFACDQYLPEKATAGLVEVLEKIVVVAIVVEVVVISSVKVDAL